MGCSYLNILYTVVILDDQLISGRVPSITTINKYKGSHIK